MKMLRLAGLLLCLTATAAFAQTVPYQRLLASDTVRAAFLNEVTTSLSNVLVKEYGRSHQARGCTTLSACKLDAITAADNGRIS
jgi:hypothetical protein